jgi:hypothetical protein
MQPLGLDLVGQFHRYILLYFARTGQPPPQPAIQRVFEFTPEEIEHALDDLEAQRAIYRDPTTRAILAAYPFSATPTAHRVVFDDGRAVFAMCAIDALGIPVMLNENVRIESQCAHCGQDIRIGVRQNALVEVAPRDVRVLRASGSKCCISALERCPVINFYCSPDHLGAWRASHPDARGHELALARALARGRAVFGSLLKTESQEVTYAKDTNAEKDGRRSRAV